MEDTQSARVLLVSTDEHFSSVVTHVLGQGPGRVHAVLWHRTAGTALDALGQTPPVDVVLVDHALSGDVWQQFVRDVRTTSPELPVILVATQKDFHVLVDAIKHQVDDYIVRDESTGGALHRTIANVLERARLKRAIAARQKADLIAKRRAEAIKELVVTVCHEFNNPLAAIKISTDILLRQNLSPEEKHLVSGLDRQIHLIEAEITRLRNISLDPSPPPTAS